MAAGATVFKADLQIADMERNYYQRHSLTLARHPSETDERLMVRLLAFALHADEALCFGRGLSADDEPALWQKDLTGVVELWIEVGQPDERAVRRACGRSKQVKIVCYGSRGVDTWWQQNRDKLARLRNLTVIQVPAAASQALATLANRNMQLQCNIQDGLVWMIGGSTVVQVEPVTLVTPDAK
jgi:uncharacterized protein YaeQ